MLWSFASLDLEGHQKLIAVLRWGNFVAPPIYAVRAPLWAGEAPRVADVVYLAVAAVVALGLGAWTFSRVDDRIAVEL